MLLSFQRLLSDVVEPLEAINEGLSETLCDVVKPWKAVKK
jgi:hypothetical protein